jgi:hypothetical protein
MHEEMYDLDEEFSFSYVELVQYEPNDYSNIDQIELIVTPDRPPYDLAEIHLDEIIFKFPEWDDFDEPLYKDAA